MAANSNNGGGPGNHGESPLPHKGNQVIHIRGDSDSELQALFDSVLQPNSARRHKVVPFRLRKLPDSFFNPPSTGSRSPSVSVNHSRENSVDSTLNAIRKSPMANNGMGAGGHHRAHSSPATLEQTYSVAAAQSSLLNPTGSPLQSGSSGNLSEDPLPPGWEQSCTTEGQIYYINHITRSTTWEDPRKAQHQQILAAVGGEPGNPNMTGSNPSLNNNSSGASTTPSGIRQGIPNANGPLPEGWEQSMTPDGEVYFINHQNRTTSWFDPRLPAHLQRPPVLQQQLNAAALAQAAAGAAAAAAAAAAGNGGTTAAASQLLQMSRQQELRLQQLQMERERLKLRQQEIVRQMEAEQARLRNSRVAPAPTKMEDGLELDPFLSGSMGNPSTPGPDFHSRQESADSGLGGMANNYTLPSTPEDFLSPMDDNMDTISENGLGGASLDTGDIPILGNDPVDSTDDLVPSLLPEELSSELLDEMQSIINSKSDNGMTWL